MAARNTCTGRKQAKWLLNIAAQGSLLARLSKPASLGHVLMFIEVHLSTWKAQLFALDRGVCVVGPKVELCGCETELLWSNPSA